MLRECVILVLVCVLEAGSLSGRGFFCRDPDTGKLHPVNSTWPASSFCGNFHCMLRRKNVTETEYAPRRQINITNVKLTRDDITKNKIKNHTVFQAKSEFSPNVISTDKKTANDTGNDPLPLNSRKTMGLEDNFDDKNETDQDRYLSDTEIRTLTEMLHTVKKSDLDAIVEIYNLAQDIYKEIDKPDQTVDKASYAAKTASNYNKDFIRQVKKNGRVSYWYEPLSNGKIRPADLLRSDMSRAETIRNDMVPMIPAIPTDMEQQGSKILSVAQMPYKNFAAHPTPGSQAPFNTLRKMTDTFLNGPFTHKDFGKLPYYYPMSSFQRLSSYIHRQKQAKISPKVAIANTASKPATYRPPTYSSSGKYQKEIKPSILLPYPFSNIHHYNWTYPQNIYSVHRNSRIEKFDSRRKDNTANANYNIKKVQKPSNVVLMNPDLENFQDLEVKPTIKEEKLSIPALLQKLQDHNLKPDWQTDSLPKHILDEVSAHVLDNHGLLMHAFPLRKKVKLERVGKLIKMDDGIRNKRSTSKSTENNVEPLKLELYEVYIERTTCNSDYSVPGFFRYGNLSQPFPECCPQRIPTR